MTDLIACWRGVLRCWLSFPSCSAFSAKPRPVSCCLLFVRDNSARAYSRPVTHHQHGRPTAAISTGLNSNGLSPMLENGKMFVHGICSTEMTFSRLSSHAGTRSRQGEIRHCPVVDWVGMA
ncbi:hypothetical protein ACOMHN_043998 [Nucella lapillus]